MDRAKLSLGITTNNQEVSYPSNTTASNNSTPLPTPQGRSPIDVNAPLERANGDDGGIGTTYDAISATSMPSNQDDTDSHRPDVADVDGCFAVNNSPIAPTTIRIPREVGDVHNGLNGDYWKDDVLRSGERKLSTTQRVLSL